MAKSPKGDGITKTLTEMGLQSFHVEKMHRRSLRGAPYNPRLIGEAEKRKLRSGLKKHGLVATLTWNKRTGNLVGGHQRISQLDALAGTDDYELDVAVIDVEETREKELNLLLNNTSAMGDFDMDGLQALLRTPGLELEGAGFDHSDIFQLFGDGVLADRDDGALDEFAQKVRDMRGIYDNITLGQGNRNSDDFYIVVVFKDEAARDAFCAKHKLPENRYQSGEEIDRLCSTVENVVDGAV